MPQKTELLEIDLFNMKPIPGSSLTEEPGKRPYERPPQIVEADKALQYCLNGLLGNAAVRDELFDLLDIGISVETVASAFTLQAFSEGVFDPNIAETIKKPLMQFITQEASRAGIEDLNVINEDMPKIMNDSDKIQIMSTLNPRKHERFMEEGISLMEEEEDMMMPMEDTSIQSEGFINKAEMT